MITTTPAPIAGRQRIRLATIALATIASLVIGPFAAHAAEPGITQPAAEEPSDSSGTDLRSLAAFEGVSLDLSKSWGDAGACWVDEDGAATCYRTEKDMDAAIVAAGGDLGYPAARPDREDLANGARMASCSSSLRLYRNNSYSGGTLYLTQRYSWINMSWYGFDNDTSSYRVGACSTTFRSGSYGGGTTYWGGTGAYNSRSSMTGWNNVLSSVRIS